MKALEQLNKYLEKQKAAAHVFEGHPLGKCHEHVKQVYIQLLKLVLMDQGSTNAAQDIFLEQLIASIELENKNESLDEIKVNDNFIELLGELFLKYFKGSILRYNFVLDALLVLMKANKMQKEFMGLLCEVLGFQEAEIIFLMNLAECLLEEDSLSYMQLIEKAPKSMRVQNFMAYAKPFLVGRLVDDEKLVIYYGNEKQNLYERPSFNEIFRSEEMSLERWVFKQEVLVFEYWKIDLSHKNWQFRNNQKVIFKNCEIIGENEPISFDGSAEIIIEDCTFTYFNNRVFLINDCLKLNLKGNLFKECIYLYDMYQNSNGCIYFMADKGMTESHENREVNVTDNSFIDCSVWNKEGHYYSDYSLGYSMNVPQKILNCSFKNCLSYMGTPKRLCNGGSLLFNQAKALECTVIASHPIN